MEAANTRRLQRNSRLEVGPGAAWPGPRLHQPELTKLVSLMPNKLLIIVLSAVLVPSQQDRTSQRLVSVSGSIGLQGAKAKTPGTDDYKFSILLVLVLESYFDFQPLKSYSICFSIQRNMSIDDNSESMTRKRRNAFRLRNRVLILMTEFKSVILDPEDLKNFRVKITRLDLLAQENAVAGQQQFFTP
ncbi:hypothetical protein RJZ56_002647 [Blastomyces dermatitidis]